MTMEGRGCFIDTNLLVYSSGINLDLCHKSRQLLTGLHDKFDFLAISHQIIREFLVVVTHPRTSENPFSANEAIRCIEELQNNLVILPETDEVSEQLFQLISKYNVVGKSVHDTNIVALMLSHQIHHLATANKSDFERFTEIELITIK